MRLWSVVKQPGRDRVAAGAQVVARLGRCGAGGQRGGREGSVIILEPPPPRGGPSDLM